MSDTPSSCISEFIPQATSDFRDLLCLPQPVAPAPDSTAEQAVVKVAKRIGDLAKRVQKAETPHTALQIVMKGLTKLRADLASNRACIDYAEGDLTDPVFVFKCLAADVLSAINAAHRFPDAVERAVTALKVIDMQVPEIAHITDIRIALVEALRLLVAALIALQPTEVA